MREARRRRRSSSREPKPSCLFLNLPAAGAGLDRSVGCGLKVAVQPFLSEVRKRLVDLAAIPDTQAP
jgi:hypothetical protein